MEGCSIAIMATLSQMTTYSKQWQTHLKTHMEIKAQRIGKTIFKKEEKVGGITLPDFKT